MPNIVRQDTDHSTAILSITIEPSDYQAEYKSKLKEYRQKAQMKGFRRGQVPLSIVRKIYGKAVLGEIVGKVFQESLSNYVQKEMGTIILQPLMEKDFQTPIFYPKSSASYEYRAEVALAPEFEVLGAGSEDVYEKYKVEEIDSELIEKDWEAARKRSGTRTNITDEIAENDLVKLKVQIPQEEDDGAVDESATEDDAAADDTASVGKKVENEFSVLIGSKLTAEAKELLLSKKTGDTFEFELLQLETGLTAERVKRYFLGLEEDDTIDVKRPFHFEVTSVSRIELAEVTEDFLKQYYGAEVTTEEAARAVLEKNIRDFYGQQAEAILAQDIKERVQASNQFEVPKPFLRRWIQENNKEELSEEKIDAQLEDYKESIRWSVISQKIQKANGINVTEQEVIGSIRQQVYSQYGSYVPNAEALDQVVKSLLQDQNQINATYSNLLTNKVLNVIKGQVQIEEKVVSSEEMDKVLEDLRAAQEKKQAEALAKQIKEVEAEKQAEESEAEASETSTVEVAEPKASEENVAE
ncbi:MAG: trigger factor [Bacteroidota bacterium]